MDLKESGNALYILGVTKPELGGSEYYKIFGELGNSVPELNPHVSIEAYRRLLKAMDAGLVRSCHDCSDGGLAVAVSEMAFTGDLGVDLDIGRVPVSQNIRDDFVLFSESNGRLLVEVEKDRTKEFEEIMLDSPLAMIGLVKQQSKLTIMKDVELLLDVDLRELIRAWKTPLVGRR
jgi:phosphoribosylformylglycinamidine synthase